MSILLAALAAGAAAWSPPICANQTTNLNPATLEYLRRVDNPPAQITPAVSGYARIIARYESCDVPSGYTRIYDTERRDVVRRFFMHKEVSKVLIAKVSVRPLGVSGLATLVSIGRDSGKQGETLSTDVGNSLTILPYFRVEPNMTLQLAAAYESERTYTSTITGDALDIIDRAAKLITPATPLITASNKSRFNDASNFVDSTIDGLLKVDIKENLRADSTVGTGKTTLAQLVLYATGANDPYARKPAEYTRPVGIWTIQAETFGGSLFTGGEGDGATPSVASVLNFQVTDGKRVREMLAGDTIITTVRDAVGEAIGDAKKAAAGALCRAVASRADAEGFSTEDVNWIVAAYVADMAPTQDSGISSGCAFSSVSRIYSKEIAAKK